MNTEGGGSREKLEMHFATLWNFLQQKKHTEAETTKEGGGNWEYKVREARNSDPPSPPPPPHADTEEC